MFIHNAVRLALGCIERVLEHKEVRRQFKPDELDLLEKVRQILSRNQQFQPERRMFACFSRTEPGLHSPVPNTVICEHCKKAEESGMLIEGRKVFPVVHNLFCYGIQDAQEWTRPLRISCQNCGFLPFSDVRTKENVTTVTGRSRQC
jgi:hypothetical protein